MKRETNTHLRTSVIGLLGLGNLLYLLFAIDISWLSNWNIKSILVLSVGVIYNCFNILLISKKQYSEDSANFNLLISSNFIGSLLAVTVALGLSANPNGSFFYILVMILAITEVNFIFDRKYIIGLYLISLLFLLYGMGVVGISFPVGFRSAFGFSLLLLWKTLNQFFHRRFVVGRENMIRHNTFHSTVNTLQNELNNTSHVIMGYTQLMEQNHSDEKKKEYMVRINNGLDKMSTQIKKIRELEKIVVDENYKNSNFIRID